MAKIQAGQPVDLIVLSKASAPIGAVESSLLTLAQFQDENLGTWMEAKGDSCAGTYYATVTGKLTVPNAYTDGLFFRQAKAGRTIGSLENDAFQDHTHGVNMNNADSGTGDNANRDATVNNYQLSTTGAITGRVADETRPKNFAGNFFIKVGY